MAERRWALQDAADYLLEQKFEDARTQHFVHDMARTLNAVLTAVVVNPCHVTGMHTPGHHVNGSVCDIMLSKMAKNILEAVGIENTSLIPRDLHDEGCGWCHEIPTQEEYRQRLRESYEWAARIPPAELLEPASDAVLPGDTKRVLEALSDEWQTWQAVTKTLAQDEPEVPTTFNGIPDGGTTRFFSTTRYWRIIERLVADGRVERNGISARLTQTAA